MPRKNRRTRSKSIRRSNRRSVRRTNRRKSLRRSNRRTSLRRSNRRKSLRRSNRRRTARRNVDEKYGGAWKALRALQPGPSYTEKLESWQKEKKEAELAREKNLRERARLSGMKDVEDATISEVEIFLKVEDRKKKVEGQIAAAAKQRKAEQDELNVLRVMAKKLGIEDSEIKDASQLKKDIKAAEDLERLRETALSLGLDDIQKLSPSELQKAIEGKEKQISEGEKLSAAIRAWNKASARQAIAERAARGEVQSEDVQSEDVHSSDVQSEEVQSEYDYNKIMDDLEELRGDIRNLNEKCVSYSAVGDTTVGDTTPGVPSSGNDTTMLASSTVGDTTFGSSDDERAAAIADLKKFRTSSVYKAAAARAAAAEDVTGTDDAAAAQRAEGGPRTPAAEEAATGTGDGIIPVMQDTTGSDGLDDGTAQEVEKERGVTPTPQ